MSAMQTQLQNFIGAHGAAAGTVHVLESERLCLRAAHNIPEKVQQITAEIPKGKGMAGLAWERRIPVSTCNLQTDQTGDVRPGAKAVGAQAAVAIPLFIDDTDQAPLWGVVGIAFMDERDITDDELEQLAADARERFQR
jgi:L-methionine (R)-S-oxide reductase